MVFINIDFTMVVSSINAYPASMSRGRNCFITRSDGQVAWKSDYLYRENNWEEGASVVLRNSMSDYHQSSTSNGLK